MTNEAQREPNLPPLPTPARLVARAVMGASLVLVAGCSSGATGPGSSTSPNPSSASATSDSPAVDDAGIVRGTVAASPTCPVQRVGESCTRPVTHGNVTAEPDGQTVTLDDTGAFELELPTGTYTLTVTTTEARSCPPTTVTITAHQATSVAVDCDTGIR
jgi:hypothetical protein